MENFDFADKVHLVYVCAVCVEAVSERTWERLEHTQSFDGKRTYDEGAWYSFLEAPSFKRIDKLSQQLTPNPDKLPIEKLQSLMERCMRELWSDHDEHAILAAEALQDRYGLSAPIPTVLRY